MPRRFIGAREAADLIGKRFYGDDWKREDLAALLKDQTGTPDLEARDRANSVEKHLYHYIVGGFVRVYAPTADGDGLGQLPTNWLTSSSFKISLDTGSFRVFSDQWDRLFIDKIDLVAAIPNNARGRKKHTFEWKVIVHEAWKFALSQDILPTKAALIDHLGDWCITNDQGVPDSSVLAEVAREVVDFLAEREARKFLDSNCLEAGAARDE